MDGRYRRDPLPSVDTLLSTEHVDRDLIESVIWDAAQAPPPFSSQIPWTFNVIEGVERIAALGARAMDHARATRPDSASRLWLDRPGFKIFWNAPC
jgi:hypothetical protein